MLCWLRKKKIFEYAIGEMGAENAKKVEKHLRVCSKCREYVSALKKIGNMNSGDEQPFLSEVFWRKFDERLDLNIAQQKAPLNIALRKVKFLPNALPRFAFSAALAVCIVLVFVFYSLNSSLNVRTIALQDEALIETALLIEEDSEIYLNGDEDAYIEEVLLQMSLAGA